MQDSQIGIIGAGVVGLSTALWLQKAGYQVTLIDKELPGMGASFGNAGLFADYARLPFARFSMMRKMPGLLMDSSSPLSMHSNYIPKLLPYGWRFFKACFADNYAKGKIALSQLHQHTVQADETLLRISGAQDLIKAQGCLGLFADQQDFQNAQQGDLLERRQQGVNLEFLNAGQVADLEPDLAAFHAGGVFYPDTRFTVSPLGLCRRYAEHFTGNGGKILRDQALSVTPKIPGVSVKLTDETLEFDHLVICAGVASKELLTPLGVKMPMVSERGYHLTLDLGEKQLQRPVGWLDKSVFLTPMAGGVRLAGTAEFAAADAPLDESKAQTMLEHAKVMLGETPHITSTWVGSRPSTPDSLPVIGPLQRYPQISLGFGHGHLGLTFGAVTGQLISCAIQGEPGAVDLTPFAPERFN
ncbi:NAD(P)/FAD-dependent oxidoreductase [Aliamphritea hakodatensis]|uniref:NAD(P)/FAD-dependent oxidoreductase n=1 Tax=Aliamphritea hakodatensis TaxID=2895352 RepID=UPI0022FD4C1D|nr:FAD-dependent oxidoreductase [Aliamphritea hakodatensis]